MAIEDLRVIGNVLYERRSDGLLYPVRQVAGQNPAQSEPQAPQGLLSGIPELGRMVNTLGTFNQMFNPVEGIGQSMDASRRMVAPDTSTMDRIAALGDMLSGIASVTAPIGAAVRAGTPAAVALMEGLLGGSPTVTAARDTARSVARTVAERANQRGPVPTMYSNPVPGLLGSGNDLQRARVNDLIDKYGGDVQAAKEYLKNSLPSIPASSQDFWQRTLDNFDYLAEPKPVQPVSTPVAQSYATIGNPEYSTGHTAPHPGEGAMMHDLYATFPDISTNGRQYYGTGMPYDGESFGPISRANGRPNAGIYIYRAVPKDVSAPKINAGDWVTTSLSYAKEHGKENLGNKYKILKQKVRADELATNGDSIHEWGYWPRSEADKAKSSSSADQPQQGLLSMGSK
jgi:hypothetical protein